MAARSVGCAGSASPVVHLLDGAAHEVGLGVAERCVRAVQERSEEQKSDRVVEGPSLGDQPVFWEPESETHITCVTINIHKTLTCK